MGLRIDVFVAEGDEGNTIVDKVRSAACPACEVMIHHIVGESCNKAAAELIEKYDITVMPAVVIGGKKVDPGKLSRIRLAFKNLHNNVKRRNNAT